MDISDYVKPIQEQESVILSEEECKGLFQIITTLTGSSPESVFAWDGTDTLKDPTTSALVKVYEKAGGRIPVFKEPK